MTNLRKFIVATLLLLLSLFVISCDNAFSAIIEDSIQEPSKTEVQSPYLLLTVEEASSRNILTPIPDPSSRPVVSVISPSLFSDIVLSGTRAEGGSISVSAANFTELAQRRIYLEEGLWTFNLVAYCGKTEASAGGKYTATQTLNVVSGANPLTMTLAPAPLSQSTEAERLGRWQASLEFPADTIDLIRVKVYNYSTFAAGITASSPAVQTLPDFVKGSAYDGTGNQTVTINESSLSMGSYVIYIEYFTQITYENAAPELQLLNTWAELLRINPGAKSEGTITLPAADPVYTITYDLGPATWDTSTTELIPLSFTRNSGTITLPTVAALSVAGFTLSDADCPYEFVDWYDETVAGSCNVLSSGSFAAATNTHNIKLYARWKEPDVYISAAGSDTYGFGSKKYPYKTAVKAYENLKKLNYYIDSNKKNIIHILSDYTGTDAITEPWGDGSKNSMDVDFVGEKGGIPNSPVTLCVNMPSDQSFIYLQNLQQMTFNHINITSTKTHSDPNGYGCLSCTAGTKIVFENSSIKGVTANGCSAINVEGVAYLKNCEISENNAIDADPSAVIWGCAVTVKIDTGMLHLDGKVVIKNNEILKDDGTGTPESQNYNLYVGNGTGASILPLYIDGPLTGSDIYVKLAQEPRTFTSGYGTYNSGVAPSTYFHSDSGMEVVLVSGEARVSMPQILYVSSSGNDTSGNGSEAYPFGTIGKAIRTFTAGNDNQLDAVIKVSGTVPCNTTIVDTDTSGAEKLVAHSLTIEGVGTTPTLSGNSSGTVLDLRTSVPITLKDLIIKEGKTDTRGGGLYIDGATVEINNCIIENNKAEIQGGGIYIAASSSLTMNGENSYIRNNRIVGDRNDPSPITPESKKSGGGVFVAQGGSFTMNAGTIRENGATDSAGGVYTRGTFTMEGGTITTNKRYTYNDDPTILDSNYDVSMHCDNVEVGIPGLFELKGGIITSEYTELSSVASSCGVCLYATSSYSDPSGTAKFNMYGGSIEGITSQRSAVYLYSGSPLYNLEFNMSGGSIKDNVIGSGGAVCIGTGSHFNMTGGEISGNHSNSGASGLYLEGTGSTNAPTITLGASGETSEIIIKENTYGSLNSKGNIRLRASDIITVAGPLSTASEVGITRIGGFSSTPFTSGYASTNDSTAPDQIFTSDDGYRIIAGTGGEAAFGASSGGLYLPDDYNFTFTASRNKVVVGNDADVTITPTVKRTEASGAEIDLFYNSADHKLYVDSLYTLPAGGDNEVTWEAFLWCGSEIEQASLTAVDTDSNANKFTIAALDYPDTYTLRVRATYMGYTHDASFTVQCQALDSVLEGFVAVTGATVTGAVSGSSVFITGRTVTIPNLYVCDHEVTQTEFQTVMGTNPSNFSSSPATGEIQGNRPVEKASWYAAIAYCNKKSLAEGLDPCYTVSGVTDWINLAYSSIPTSTNSNWDSATCDFTANGYRLPTEAEWEYIERGGNGGIPAAQTTYSGSETVGDVAWYTSNSSSKTHEVKKKTANTLGIYDMSGNVVEWCWDWFGSIGSGTGSTGPSSGSSRVYRGGCWSVNDSGCTVSYRSFNSPYGRYTYIGFRVVRTAD